jgi:hypothetical protein
MDSDRPISREQALPPIALVYLAIVILSWAAN